MFSRVKSLTQSTRLEIRLVPPTPPELFQPNVVHQAVASKMSPSAHSRRHIDSLVVMSLVREILMVTILKFQGCTENKPTCLTWKILVEKQTLKRA